jgi:predicted nucleic acid-binding protein
VVIHLDAAFVIDLLREQARGRPGPALDWIEAADENDTVAISVHVVCELRVGAELARQPVKEHEALDDLLSAMLMVYPDDRFAAQYARTLAALHRIKKTMATMDLLIATAALLDDAPLVTRNLRDFSRVPGLRLIPY